MIASPKLFRHLVSEYARTALAVTLGLVSIALVVEFVDNSKWYSGEGWVLAVLELYFWRGLLVAQEFAPAAMLLGAGVQWAIIRRRGELTAMRALALGPSFLIAPFMVVAVALAGLTIAGDGAFKHARRRADEINVGKFNLKSTWLKGLTSQQWFRGENDIYRVRGIGEKAYLDVTIYSLSESFRLARRIDVAQLEPIEGRRWRLRNGVIRELNGDETRWETFDEREMELDQDAAAFRLARGQPEQMSLSELREQRQLRERVGLPSQQYTFALHNKLAYPLAAVPGVLLACSLGLRRGRKGTLATAVAEGFVIVAIMWTLSMGFRAASFAGSVTPVTGAWAPVVVMAVVAVVARVRLRG